ncbi:MULTISPECIES: hypothetical protein [Dyella]|uniref:Uncharacterized protein n=2 Tax=Dyella TaxID=231454 RepID=A0A4R0YYU7_9GAMM|nr:MULTISPECIES: hypothetical protein [Dyella]TBR39841.1 hypothetical protein EYV96_06560 [Dyella terrae]TCI12579.1 hypothetical protein EZM97_04310 [Dyella soli]
MRRSERWMVGLGLAMGVVSGGLAQDANDLTPSRARALFDEAKQQCDADGGKLWGRSLCGPMMIVEPATRRVSANAPDRYNALVEEHGVFIGRLPEGETIANTSVEWSGVKWVQVQWPMPTDAVQQRVLMAHESFHRVQAELGLEAKGEQSNGHLDELQGRYLLQLEWRALAAALKANDDATIRAHARDALMFRDRRYATFPQARAAERSLERNEGLAEYTGIMIGGSDPSERTALALHDLSSHVADPSFVRSFAYATGPAYGLLLDRYAPDWRVQIREQADETPASLLAMALKVSASATQADAQLAVRAKAYDGATLLAGETKRAAERERELATYRNKFVQSPILVLPLSNPRVMFDPRNLVAMGAAGTVYPSAKFVADWGSLEVRDGALLAGDWSKVQVPRALAAPGQHGTIGDKGWTLVLADGWQIVPGERDGDVTVKRVAQTP